MRIFSLIVGLAILAGCRSEKPAPPSSDAPVMVSVSESNLLEGQVGYVAIRQFGRTAGEETVQALDLLKRRGMKRWVLDLRGNWGGSLAGACGVVGLFCAPGTEVGVYHEPQGARRKLKVGGSNPIEPPRAILVDQATASTAEWVAGTLRHLFQTKLVGARTYGKGRVQQVSEMGHRRLAIVTEGRVDLPSGGPVTEAGLQPDVRTNGRENMLKRAVEAAQRS